MPSNLELSHSQGHSFDVLSSLDSVSRAALIDDIMVSEDIKRSVNGVHQASAGRSMERHGSMSYGMLDASLPSEDLMQQHSDASFVPASSGTLTLSTEGMSATPTSVSIQLTDGGLPLNSIASGPSGYADCTPGVSEGPVRSSSVMSSDSMSQQQFFDVSMNCTHILGSNGQEMKRSVFSTDIPCAEDSVLSRRNRNMLGSLEKSMCGNEMHGVHRVYSRSRGKISDNHHQMMIEYAQMQEHREFAEGIGLSPTSLREQV